MAFILEQQHVGGGSQGYTLPAVGGPYNFTRRAQVFTANSNYTLTRIALYLYASSYPKDCLFSLYSTSGGVPLSLLTSGTIDILGTISYLTLAIPVVLSNGDQYALVTDAPASGTSTALYVSSDPGGTPFYWDSNGSTWVGGVANSDIMYKLFSGSEARTINLSSPTNEDTGIILQPLLEWSIDGSGAVEGDLLDIYLRKDDANFTSDDLLAGFVDATLNSDLQVVGGLEYDTTYYWQVQAYASGEGVLISSGVWSFTTQPLSYPTYSVHPVSGLPTGDNTQITIRRLIAAANNKIWYEDI